jgi:LysM repeat protein
LPIKQAWQRVVELERQITSIVQIPQVRPLQTVASAGSSFETPAAAIAQAGSTIAAAESLTPTRSISLTSLVLTPLRPVTPTLTITATLTATAVVTPTATPAPTGTAALPTETPAPPTATPGAVKYYTVRAGDTLIGIGAATGYDWGQIASLNGLTANSSLWVGQKLRLPGSEGSTAPAPAAKQPTTYRVQAGDTLQGIGARFGVSWQAIASANKLTQNSVLRIGQQLVIPAP